ncbi:MAG: hypothetical protein A3H96_07215 [Acidobacteria bacterium RIFCSPLOWO2_02_FULL_67_36]|nr:MAG: hypothetical protein A3H96_07215 [Acidobacteria bacterium RIFCSPLOWO2_02_FULL_67_36]OFW26487.1 MAG: hypothetical protein A3G21_24110 [Acidobacteria bacterium RIFCSPLOWO2_12_FULL_66_21]
MKYWGHALMSVQDILIQRIRERGPITVAEFMEIALYHPGLGYYATAAQRSGRAGDFYTSVDVGPLFGELVAEQIAEMWERLRERGATTFDLVEAGAGNGRLARDILDALAAAHRGAYARLRLTLVEASAAARAAQHETLRDHRARIVGSVPDLPSSVRGVILANELLDALPVHLVTMTGAGLREILIGEHDGRLVETEGPPSDPRIAEYLASAGATLERGARAEVGLAACRWIDAAASALAAGFLLLFDYGHEAPQLYSPTHYSGTLAAYRAHTAGAAGWLQDPGSADLTSHVNLTAIRQAAEAAGLTTMGIVDQTYFLIALGLAERIEKGDDLPVIKRRLAARTLMMPGGLGSTMKVMAFGRHTGRGTLRGVAHGRLT